MTRSYCPFDVVKIVESYPCYPVPCARVCSMTCFFWLFNSGFSPFLPLFDFGFLNVIIGLRHWIEHT